MDKNGRFERKSLTMFWSFVMANLIAIYIIVSDYVLPKGRELNQFVGDAFWGFLVGAIGTGALTLWEKLGRGRNKEGRQMTDEG
jgi:hypothetical protein